MSSSDSSTGGDTSTVTLEEGDDTEESDFPLNKYLNKNSIEDVMERKNLGRGVRKGSVLPSHFVANSDNFIRSIKREISYLPKGGFSLNPRELMDFAVEPSPPPQLHTGSRSAATSGRDRGDYARGPAHSQRTGRTLSGRTQSIQSSRNDSSDEKLSRIPESNSVGVQYECAETEPRRRTFLEEVVSNIRRALPQDELSSHNSGSVIDRVSRKKGRSNKEGTVSMGINTEPLLRRNNVIFLETYCEANEEKKVVRKVILRQDLPQLSIRSELKTCAGPTINISPSDDFEQDQNVHVFNVVHEPKVKQKEPEPVLEEDVPTEGITHHLIKAAEFLLSLVNRQRNQSGKNLRKSLNILIKVFRTIIKTGMENIESFHEDDFYIKSATIINLLTEESKGWGTGQTSFHCARLQKLLGRFISSICRKHKSLRKFLLANKALDVPEKAPVLSRGILTWSDRLPGGGHVDRQTSVRSNDFRGKTHAKLKKSTSYSHKRQDKAAHRKVTDTALPGDHDHSDTEEENSETDLSDMYEDDFEEDNSDAEGSTHTEDTGDDSEDTSEDESSYNSHLNGSDSEGSQEDMEIVGSQKPEKDGRKEGKSKYSSDIKDNTNPRYRREESNEQEKPRVLKFDKEVLTIKSPEIVKCDKEVLTIKSPVIVKCDKEVLTIQKQKCDKEVLTIQKQKCDKEVLTIQKQKCDKEVLTIQKPEILKCDKEVLTIEKLKCDKAALTIPIPEILKCDKEMSTIKSPEIVKCDKEVLTVQRGEILKCDKEVLTLENAKSEAEIQKPESLKLDKAMVINPKEKEEKLPTERTNPQRKTVQINLSTTHSSIEIQANDEKNVRIVVDSDKGQGDGPHLQVGNVRRSTSIRAPVTKKPIRGKRPEIQKAEVKETPPDSQPITDVLKKSFEELSSLGVQMLQMKRSFNELKIETAQYRQLELDHLKTCGKNTDNKRTSKRDRTHRRVTYKEDSYKEESDSSSLRALSETGSEGEIAWDFSSASCSSGEVIPMRLL